MIKKTLKKILSKIFAPLESEINTPEYIKQIKKAYKAGYDYHKKAIKNDTKLLQWILQDDYFDS
jgi:hypothetical protein